MFPSVFKIVVSKYFPQSLWGKLLKVFAIIKSKIITFSLNKLVFVVKNETLYTFTFLKKLIISYNISLIS